MKGKVEARIRLLGEIDAYRGKDKAPILAIKKKKNRLRPLPADSTRDSYRNRYTLVKVNASNMISYKSNQYSVLAMY